MSTPPECCPPAPAKACPTKSNCEAPPTANFCCPPDNGNECSVGTKAVTADSPCPTSGATFSCPAASCKTEEKKQTCADPCATTKKVDDCAPAKVDACAPAKVDACAPAKVDTCAPAKVDTCAPAKVDTCATKVNNNKCSTATNTNSCINDNSCEVKPLCMPKTASDNCSKCKSDKC